MNLFNPITRSFVLIAASACAAFTSMATTADAVIDRYIASIGGEAAIEKLENMETTITMTMPAAGMSIPMRMVAQHPNRIYVEQTIPGMGQARQGYNGAAGWSVDPLQGERALSPEEIKELTQDASPKWVLGIKERYPVRSIASETEATITLELKESSDGDANKWTFSKESGLLIQQEAIVNMGPMGTLPVKTFISDYRAVNAVKFPYVTRVENPAMQFELQIQTLEFNVTVDPALFESPF